ncbi:MAG TPA: hypothetical protein PLX06_08030, partial [Fimbriimonadaceae bacterium]|nr:hypothetical protein [Fimbriimonadaceae bacterium]
MRLAFFLVLCLSASLSFAQKVPRQPYFRHQAADAQGRAVTYYLSEPAPGEPAEIPLVVYVQGSGWSSHFIQSSDGRIVGANGHSSIADVVRGKARLMLIEKPGVNYLEASSEPGGPEAFRKAFTADRWGDTVRAAVGKYLKEHPKTSRLLVAGHSEGGLIAAMLATVLEVPATHLAILAGGGPSQLFDLITLARRGDFFASISDDPEKRVQHVLAEWDKITKDPGSHEKLFFGHTYQRWFSFLARSVNELADLTLAKVMIVQGGMDRA